MDFTSLKHWRAFVFLLRNFTGQNQELSLLACNKLQANPNIWEFTQPVTKEIEKTRWTDYNTSNLDPALSHAVSGLKSKSTNPDKAVRQKGEI